MRSAAVAVEIEPTPMRAALARTRTPCRVSPLRREDCAEWDRYVTVHPDGTLFHTSAWRSAVRGAFGHEDVYLHAVREGRTVGVLPLFVVASRLAGRMLVSVPYGVGGGIVADDEDVVAALFGEAKRLMEKHRCGSIDFRSERVAVANLPATQRYVGFRRELPRERGDVLTWLPRKARAAARNARDRFGLTAAFGDEHIKKVWDLYAQSMRRLGSLAYPFSFFQQLLAATPDRHWVSTVKWNGETVAGLVTFLFRDRVMPYFIGTNDDARRCSAANYLYLSVMERGVEHGYRSFDFGRSRSDNTGSYDFKRFNGFTPRPLEYQCYVAPGTAAPDLSPNSPRFRVARTVWKHLPLVVTKALGARIAKHIPG